MKYLHTFLSYHFFLLYIVDFVSTHGSSGWSWTDFLNNIMNAQSSTADQHTVGQHWVQGHKTVGWKLPYENKHVVYTRNEVQCLLSCFLARSTCAAVYYKKAEMRCKHHYGDRIYMLEGTSNDVVIISPNLISFYATTKYNNNTGRTFDFATAKSVCEEFAGRLSNRTELEEMYADGVRHCWCAWLSDGTQGFVNQGVWDHCRSSANGTRYECDNTSLAHAWCTVTGLHK